MQRRGDGDAAAAAATYRGGAIGIHNVVAPAPVPAGDSAPPVAVYFQVMNTGARADTLDAVEVADAHATLHDRITRGPGREVMVPVSAAPVPAGSMLRLFPGGRHVMIEGLARPVVAGGAVPMTLVFRHAGRIAVSARVVPYADVGRALAGGADEHAGH